MEELMVSPPANRARPWGLWATLGFTVIVIIVSFIVQLVVTIVFLAAAVIQNPNFDLVNAATALTSSGLYFALAEIMSGVFCIPLVALLAKLRKGVSLRDYLAMRMTTMKELAKWVLFTLILIAAAEVFSSLTNLGTSSEIMVNMYRAPYYLPAVLLAVLIVAPLLEEILVRGFMFQGIVNSRLGAVGAILLTSLGWAALHIQYDYYGIANIFVIGLLFGLARLKTNSTYVTMAMHFVVNLIASIQILLSIYVLT